MSVPSSSLNDKARQVEWDGDVWKGRKDKTQEAGSNRKNYRKDIDSL